MAAGDERLERYADLVVRVGVNIGPGQPLLVLASLEHAPLVRAIARAAYRAGASSVEVNYGDAFVRRALIELGPDEALELTHPWRLQQMRELADANGALIQIAGEPNPN